MSLRSVLWIGPAPGFDAAETARSPALDVAWVRDVDEALELPLEAFDILVLDGPDRTRAVEDGRRLLERSPLPPVLARLPVSDLAASRELRELGVRDVWAADEPSGALLRRLASLGEPPAASAPRGSIVGRSRAMLEVFALVERAQRSNANVLLAGDTGTGKELLAREIHCGSGRREQPFVAINCAAFPDTLLESELFGHVRGSFTKAPRLRQERCSWS